MGEIIQQKPNLKRLAKCLQSEAIPGAYGCTNKDGEYIKLATQDTQTFFHELAHIAHSKIETLNNGQDARQEAIADFTAAVLMETYGLGDRTGNAFNYIKMYCADPLKAVKDAIDTITKVMAVLNEATAH